MPDHTHPPVTIPNNVRKAARLGLQLSKYFDGGTNTGWRRAEQLTHNRKTIDAKSLADMRAWFARHGPDASNGGTSYPGYLKWVQAGKPMQPSKEHKKSMYRGAVAWLIWGGDAAYRWLKTDAVRKLLKQCFPKRKEAKKEINL